MRDGIAFASFFQGGFECSTQLWHDGRQLDLVASTAHDRRADEDYAKLRGQGILTVRDGLRWHLIEASPGTYDWASFMPMLRAARRHGMQVMWDLCHYGVPRWLDVASPGFVRHFAAFAAAAARLIRAESGMAPVLCPMNEMSFWAWAGGNGVMHPRMAGRALKRRLAGAAIAAIDAVRAVDPEARFIQAEPLIEVVPRPGMRGDPARARVLREAQFEATDMLAGRLAPELGGSPDHLDVIGLNFYSYNEWHVGGETIYLGHRHYRPLHELLAKVHARYGRPLTITETGAEGPSGPAWLRYVAGEVRIALRAGIPVGGICLYPVLDYPGWENDRHCRCGLLTTGPDYGERAIDPGLAAQLAEERVLTEPLLAGTPALAAA